MKRIISLIVVSFLIFCLVSCGKTDGEDYQSSENKEDVLSVAEESKFAEVNELIKNGNYEEAYSKLDEFGDDSEAVEMKSHFRYIPVSIDGRKFYEDFIYNDNNLLVQYIETHKDNNNQRITDYVYDENGRLIKEKVSNGTVREYTYDENGNLIKEIETDSDGDIFTYEYIYDETGALIKKLRMYPSGSVYFYEYCYDENKNLIEEIKGQNDSITERIEYIYDEKGNVIEKYHNANKSVTKEYVYDENGRVIKETEILSAHGLNYYKEYTYDERGNLIRKTMTNANGESNAYENTYDENNNLIKRVLYGVDGPSTYRTFAYDENGNFVKLQYNDGSEAFTCEFTYKFVYIPFDLAENVEELLNPEDKWFDELF